MLFVDDACAILVFTGSAMDRFFIYMEKTQWEFHWKISFSLNKVSWLFSYRNKSEPQA